MIPKEAIDAAMDAYREGMYLTDDQVLASVTAILTAAFAAMPGPAVKVRELVWHAITSPREDGPPEETGYIEADTVIGEYSVCFDEDEEVSEAPWCCWSPVSCIDHFTDIEAAKAAAQADYEARILAAAIAAAEERGRSEEREQCAKLELTLTRTLGGLGAAFDPPGPHRAYTYEHQPHNGPAYNLGCAVAAAKNMPAGDEIDVGLALLKAMQARGFGVFEIKPATITKEPTP